MPTQLWRCNICGNTSEDEAKMDACEEQGDKHAYPKGTAAEFQSIKGEEWYPGIVEGIEFASGSHTPSYVMRVDEEFRAALGMKPTTELIHSFSEDVMRLPQQQPATC